MEKITVLMENHSEKNANVDQFAARMILTNHNLKSEGTKIGTLIAPNSMTEIMDYPEYDDSYEYDIENDCSFESE
ncbi:hypothetical protein SShM2_055 [Synechococcus phage S-ShM2]|uniref:Uncharacterized protein n=3 Tax=Ahtivirus sagseatwo TaxID=2734079 RepID=A0A1D7SJN2_9CAUD|nr:hypothetical protein SShM2_055 [Synechococcus phage S-ShM2]AGH57288.1 hypothetical protein CPLG_00034 [Cyanophage S-SSM2]AOO13165.1 hypothetical protein LIS021110_051 [Cyanophage S-RIM14]ADO97666.1 hypothetical protein SShM2_055 [Synechococcus phage S-ShM2]AOO13381.1 hypothetical protein LIS110610_051 [Cyanophage S-RIM14]AOO13597.1 hypothetical protein Np111211_051 [Cyanophage S-RIM14]